MMRRVAYAACAALALTAALAGCGGGDGWTARDVPAEYPTIQAAVNASRPGDLVRIAPGVYREEVVVPAAKRDVVLRGTDRNRVVLDGGDGRRHEGIVVHGDGVAIENLTVRGFGSDAILFTPPADAKRPLRGWRVSYVTLANNALHGVDALHAQGGTIDHAWASGAGSAGLRIGRCVPCDALVSDSVVEQSTTGFEGVNAGGNIVVARSRFRHNRVGVMLVTAGDDATYHQEDSAVVGNVIADNDDRHAAGRGDAFGIGVLVRGGRRDGLARNLITGHPGAGILLTSSDEKTPAAEVSVQGNVLRHNGVDLVVAPRPGQRTSNGSCFAQNRFSTSLPDAIEKALPCQADVPVRAGAPPLPSPPPRVDWRSIALPAPQPSLPAAATAKPRPARKPSRLDVAKVGVPGSS
jgi:parallel beta helix pectate lyase-like protein